MIVKVASYNIGNKNIIPIQTMLKNPVTDIDLTLEKIEQLYNEGCDLIRITVPDKSVIPALTEVVNISKIPIIADIHFDYKMAIAALEAGVAKVRINPGNIGDLSKVKKIISALKEHDKPVRIGINRGSLPRDIKEKYKNPIEMMLEAARREVKYFEDENFEKIILSFKSSSVLETIEVNKRAAKEFKYPLHLGVTEAGDKLDGAIKNTAGLVPLLINNIGDTIRVSLTADEIEEIRVGKKILESSGLLQPQIEIISCPTCGRTEINIKDMVKNFKKMILNRKYNKPLKVAIMGCIVNGPGEAEDCDFGIAGGKEKSLIFKNGRKVKIVDNIDVFDEFIKLLKSYEI